MRVPVVFTVGAAELELTLTIGDEATAADVVAALAAGPVPPGTVLVVDGRAVEPGVRAADAPILRGSVLQLALEHGGRHQAEDEPALELAVVAGLAAGATYAVPTGASIVGSATSAAIRIAGHGLSGHHARLDVYQAGDAVISDLHSHRGVAVNGGRVDGSQPLAFGDIVALGDVLLRVARPAPSAQAGAEGPVTDGRRVLHRAPRSLASQIVPSLVVPSPPRVEPATAPRLPVAAVVAPLVLGAVLAFVFGPTMALFALLGPVMATMSWADDKHRARRLARAAAKARDEHDRLVADIVARAVEAERDRLWDLHPDIAEVAQRAVRSDLRLWQRRPAHDDFLALSLGRGALSWALPGADVQAQSIDDVPIVSSLTAVKTLGVTGPGASAVARSLLVQAAVHHGPADLSLRVITAQAAAADWAWLAWLPHAEPSGVIVLDEHNPVDVRTVLDNGAAWRLVVVDGPALGPRAHDVVRRLTAEPNVAVVVVAQSARHLPASCSAVVEIPAAGKARVDGLPGVLDLRATGLAVDVATNAARALASWTDPERDGSSALPTSVAFADVVDIPHDARALADRWRGGPACPHLAAPVGVTASGAFLVDLERDGPHALLAGMTGAGKSELLRTLVTGLAVLLPPEHLNFLLVDFKGGAAFGPCAALPHTVGFVTDLDDRLARRALRSLEAELRRRERLLQHAGVDDLRAYYLRGHTEQEPLPKLLVIIDEFATMAAELPGFVEALVDVAQRGRSLGIHLLLATQRPAGAVSPAVRANTSLRMALRVADDTESADILGSPAAASVDPGTPGRGYARVGQGPLVLFQAATTSGPAQRHGDDGRIATRTVTVEPFGALRHSHHDPTHCHDDRRLPWPAENADAQACDELSRIVRLIVDAAREARCRSPRRPWLDPLPRSLSLRDVTEMSGSSTTGSPVALVDDPDHQRRLVYEWTDEIGNVLFLGDPVDGANAVRTMVAALAERDAPQALHVYALDFGPGRLRALAPLPHTGAVIAAGDRERQERLIARLHDELERRRSAGNGGAPPRIVVAIDNYGAFHGEFDDVAGLAFRERLARVFCDGPAFGMFAFVSADRPGAVPPSVAAAFRERVVFRLADPMDGYVLGLAPADVAQLGDGRGVHVASGLEIRFATVELSHEQPEATPEVGCGVRSDGAAPPVAALPGAVALSDLPAATIGGSEWRIPLAMSHTDLAPVSLRLGGGDAVLIAGGARSGKSSALAAIVESVRRAAPDIGIGCISLRPSPVRALPQADVVTTAAGVAPLIERFAAGDAPRLLVIDDADLVEDPGGAIQALVERRSEGLHIVVAARTEAVRSRFGHWTAAVRRSGVGIVLRPQSDLDGDLWHVALPRRSTALVPGRGYLVAHGEAELVQLALPTAGIAADGAPAADATSEPMSAALEGTWVDSVR